jgi:hypothetical protein
MYRGVGPPCAPPPSPCEDPCLRCPSCLRWDDVDRWEHDGSASVRWLAPGTHLRTHRALASEQADAADSSWPYERAIERGARAGMCAAGGAEAVSEAAQRLEQQWGALQCGATTHRRAAGPRQQGVHRDERPPLLVPAAAHARTPRAFPTRGPFLTLPDALCAETVRCGWVWLNRCCVRSATIPPPCVAVECRYGM